MLIRYQILQTNRMRIIWQTVRRVTDEILGFKGLREVAAMKGSMSCGVDVMGRENSEENHALFIYFPYYPAFRQHHTL